MSRIGVRIMLGVLAWTALACGDGPIMPTDLSGVPGTVSKVSGDGQSATVGTPVAIRPAVLVLAQDQKPMAGLTVRFRLTPVNGAVTGEDATTDSLGVATVGSWILGTRAGPDTLVATVADTLRVTFIASASAGNAAALVATTPVSSTSVVGSAPVVLPGVRAQDAYGNSVSGVVVTFTVISGGGAVFGAAPTTNPNGLAGVGGWSLGAVPGPNILRATATGLPPVDFTVSALAGPPVTILKLAGDGRTVNAGGFVDPPPSVQVRDSYGNALPGVAVTFTVASGGGQIAGGTRTTDSTGSAQVTSWKLGSARGTNTLAATVAGLAPATFTATAVVPCTDTAAYAIGTSFNDSLTTADCEMPSGEFTDLLSMSVAALTSVRFQMSSPLFSPDLTASDPGGALLTSTPHYCPPGGYCGDTASIRALLPPGTYVLGAGGFTYDYDDQAVGGVVGPYTFSSTLLAEDVDGCPDEPVWIVPGVTTTQSIGTMNCWDAFREFHFYHDDFNIQLTAGLNYRFTMTSTDFDTYLELWSPGYGRVAFNDDFGGSTNSQITYTPAVSGVYLLRPATYWGDSTGTYVLTVSVSGPAPAPRQVIRAAPARAVPTGGGAPVFTPRAPKARPNE